MSKIHQALQSLTSFPNRRLNRQFLIDVAEEILKGEASTGAIAGFLTALRMAGETGKEIEAFVGVMLENAKPFPTIGGDTPIVDTCGTGGDHHNTFNISTTAALLLAASGIRVAKHGNRSASSKCGSADVLEELGIPIEVEPEESVRSLEENNFCFLYARSYHPAMRHAAPARKELRIRTLFNLCGPLANPAKPTHQLVGVPARELIEPVAEALQLLGCKSALVVHGADGMDEISLSQVTEGIHLDHHGRFHPWHVSPSDLGLKPCEVSELVGGDARKNAAIMREVLEGTEGPHADVVNLNVAAVLWLIGEELDIHQGLAHARAVQRSGVGAKLLDKLATKG
ncbi:anthranilate phosphoribosyltransferase [bacterium]|nr:anthranilate phosphoribosyltransferase [bacterium]